ncbi:peptidase U35 [Caballeronia novacaledonica]|uniref:Peptidase U35 n=1 Tax=Caballeronia novacaledonica TaxID=1544861 RepID=A0ACB5R5Y1_9BURK|nr:peptidase U35 [Caballeronia novacaledonica]
MNRAISQVIVLKRVDEKARIIEGVASTPTPDSYDDVIESTGARYKLPIAFLWQHEHNKPVGHVEFAAADKRGIGFRARLAQCDEPGALHDRLEEAWQSIKAGLVRGVSIGFRPIKMEPRGNGSPGMRFTEWQWLELSAVTIPANADASIVSIRSADDAQRRVHLPPVRMVRLSDPPYGSKAR